MGAWTSLQLALEASASEHSAPLWSSLVRSTAPAASGSALLLALVLWAHSLRPAVVEAERARIFKRAAAIALPGYLVSAGVALLCGLAILGGALGAHISGITLRDFGAGGLSAAVDSALILALAWRFLARLQAARSSLPAKLIVVLTVTVPLRATIGLAFASALSL